MNWFISLSESVLPKVEAHGENDKKDQHAETKTVTSSFPLYVNSEQYEYYVDPPSKMTSYVKEARIQALKLKLELQPYFDKVYYIFKTGKSHSQETLIHLQDEDNLLSRISAMAMGGLVGLFAARKGRLLKKLTFTSLGTAGIGALCYPQEAKDLAREGVLSAKKNTIIGYHFIFGVRPKVENENGQAFEKLASTVSDVWQWGFRLFNSQTITEQLKTPEQEFKLGKEDISVPDFENITSSPKDATSSDFTDVLPEEQPKLTQTEAESKSGTGAAVEGDLGQSHVEDKEMYTTRE